MGLTLSQIHAPDEQMVKIKDKAELLNNYPEVAKKLTDRFYGLGDYLDSGSFGPVFAATRTADESTEHKYVIQFKKLSDNKKNDFLVAEVEGFTPEEVQEEYANHESRLKSLYINQLKDNFVADKIAILVFEYQAGGNLHDFIQESSNGLTEEQAARFYLQIGQGLFVIHNNGIAHRNLQPRNILLDASKTIAKISDFGMSIVCYKLHTGEALNQLDQVGTTNYMPPECLPQQQQDHYKQEQQQQIVIIARDIWAMGIMMFEMVYSFVPWEYAPDKLAELLGQPIAFVLWPRDKPTSRAFMKFLVKHFVLNPLARPKIEKLLREPFLVKGANCLAKRIDMGKISNEERRAQKAEMEADFQRPIDEKGLELSEEFRLELARRGYQLAKRLGKGGFGYVCGGKFGDKLCAVKLETKPSQESIPENVIMELTLLKKLKHPNVVEIMDFFHIENRLVITIEVASGGDLNDILRMKENEHGLSEAQAARYYLQIGSGLQYCHRMGVAHKDLKPGNILLDDTRTVCKLTDFGLSKHVYNLQSGKEQKNFEIDGTLKYFPLEYYEVDMKTYVDRYDSSREEQFVETKADIWIMGTMMFLMVYCLHPFRTTESIVGKERLTPYEEAEEMKQQMMNPHLLKSWSSKKYVTQEFKNFVIAHWKTKPMDRPTMDELLSWPYLSIAHSFPLEAAKKAPVLAIDDFSSDDSSDDGRLIRPYVPPVQTQQVLRHQAPPGQARNLDIHNLDNLPWN